MSRFVRALIIFAVAISAVTATSLFAFVSPQVSADASNDPLNQNDEDLNRSMGEIESKVRGQQAELEAATQALQVADATATNSENELVGVRANLEVLRKKAADSAIREYVTPDGAELSAVLSADEIAEAERRTVLLAQVTGENRQVYANVKAAKKELDARDAAAKAKRETANKRRDAAQKELDRLNSLLDRKRKIEFAHSARLATAAAEDSASLGEGASSTGRANRGGGMSNDSRISAAGMRTPAAGPIRSPFGPRWGRQHSGIDIGAPEGAPIYAAKAGTVQKASMDTGGYGNLVSIDHGAGVVTYYAHLSRFTTSAGARVEAGQLIGYSGHTGRVVPASAAGAHLHFEVRIGGVPHNPQNYLP